jgi:hypothetical protein
MASVSAASLWPLLYEELEAVGFSSSQDLLEFHVPLLLWPMVPSVWGSQFAENRGLLAHPPRTHSLKPSRGFWCT